MTLQHIKNWVAEIEVAAKDGDFERARQLKEQLYHEFVKHVADANCIASDDAAEALKAEEHI